MCVDGSNNNNLGQYYAHSSILTHTLTLFKLLFWHISRGQGRLYWQPQLRPKQFAMIAVIGLFSIIIFVCIGVRVCGGVGVTIYSFFVEKMETINNVIIGQRHAIFNNVVCETNKASSDQPAHTHSLIRAFASRLNILWVLSNWLKIIWSF